MNRRILRFLGEERLTWNLVRDLGVIALGTFLQALALRLFLIPANLASGGVSGIAQILNHYTGWPIGLMILIGNLPIFFLGWKYLGGHRFALRTVFAVVTVASFTDMIAPFLPAHGVTDDLVLNTLYGGITSGVGYGLVYRSQGTSGGSDVLARILNHWRGVSISQSYFMTDALVMFLAGLAFSWENALYALVMLYVTGLAAEAITEGTYVVRTAMIITSEPQKVSSQIITEMERGVTVMNGRGGYTGEEKTVLYCVVSRPEISQIKALVRDADPDAFMVIGHAHEALGEGFRPWK